VTSAFKGNTGNMRKTTLINELAMNTEEMCKGRNKLKRGHKT
jgi:hypothetical protein